MPSCAAQGGGGCRVPAFDAPALPAILAGTGRGTGRPQFPSGARPDRFQGAFDAGQLGPWCAARAARLRHRSRSSGMCRRAGSS